jgi:hypothetical protein
MGGGDCKSEDDEAFHGGFHSPRALPSEPLCQDFFWRRFFGG